MVQADLSSLLSLLPSSSIVVVVAAAAAAVVVLERDDDIETYVKAKLEQPDAHVSTHIYNTTAEAADY